MLRGANTAITAECGSGPLRAETIVYVRRDQAGPTPPRIVLEAMKSPVRGTFNNPDDVDSSDEDGVVTIKINATHPAVRRYFGPPPDFAGQESLPARLMVAEIVADLTVLNVLRRHLREQPMPVEQMYRRRFQMLNDLLPECHASQLNDPELEPPDARPRRQQKIGRSLRGMKPSGEAGR
jgi:hypothetical protein